MYNTKLYMRICLIVLYFFVSASNPCRVSAEPVQNDICSPSYAINSAQNNKGAEQVAVPIIMYHCIYGKNPGKYALPPAVLEKDLIYLKENGFNSIVIQDLLDFKEQKKKLPPKPVMLTFDDGNVTNYLYAFPLMKKYGFKCVMSVVGAYVDSNYDKNGNTIRSPLSSVSYEHIIEMQKSGLVEIQSHTYDMHKLNPRRGLTKRKEESDEEYERILTQDLMQLQLQLNKKTGVVPTAVTYPFGSYSKNTAQILEKLGFKAALTCTEGVNYITKESDLFLLKRYNRPCGIGTQDFFDRFASL